MADNPGHFFGRSSFDKLFKTSQRLDMQPGVGNVAGIIQMDGHLGMAFDSCNWLNINYFSH
jgi:hypothetical protein